MRKRKFCPDLAVYDSGTCIEKKNFLKGCVERDWVHFLNNMSFDAYDSKFRRNTDLGYVWKMPDINKIDIEQYYKDNLDKINNNYKITVAKDNK